MSDVAGPSTTDLIEQLRAQLAQAVDLVRQHEATIAALSVELDETNHGVVALYAELDDNAIRLREVSDLKSRFLSYMSHEFRTPLGSILSIARLLLAQMDGPLTAEQRTQVTFINTSASELTEMVNDLLDLAKVEAGRITISPAWFDMVDLFAALRGMFKPILASTDVSLVFEEPHGVPAIFTDDRKLSQILRNFISNALKFTTRGEVRVTATFEAGDRVRFSVSDTGIGIPPEHLPALFQDYAQVDSSLQKRLRGTGLGLSLSKKLAVMLGGDVMVTSQVGQGSTFSVVVPSRIPGHEPSHAPRAPRDQAGNDVR
ncbi:Aerobic respiration control sensor protein ArcB [Luteitalea pratensis]|uniref:histidine kinase n=1 Tax=Luteitalea pratensis TaxID=1855912 RepID=A0A143PIA5_LUTPR|nr:ATP-binding protein [Luteitalea pratensis]AMY08302.1 Aerobic respiration control sensor protein ArcB [Luteitalea pratensis]